MRFCSVTSVAKLTCLQISKNSRTLSTHSFRQAPIVPLSHYIDRETTLAFSQDHNYCQQKDGGISTEVATGVENALRVRSEIGAELTSNLLPVTELISPRLFSSNHNITVRVVSVRRGWNNRLVNRLAARKVIDADGSEIAFEAISTDSNEGLNPKAAPFLLDTLGTTERSSSDWVSGVPQVLRSNSLTRLLSRLAGVPVHLVRVNALSLARFDFDRDIAARMPIHEASRLRSSSSRLRAPTSARFLSRLEQERGSRFSAASGRLPDLLRLGFVAIYLKNASVLAQLLATSLARLPRNRKEIPFIRFRIKVVKVLVSARPERLGVRISFKGRVARWNRTKVLIGESGRLALYTYSSRLEGGRAQAITRKGTRGVRVWLAYHPSFAKRFRPTLLSFRRNNT